MAIVVPLFDFLYKGRLQLTPIEVLRVTAVIPNPIHAPPAIHPKLFHNTGKGSALVRYLSGTGNGNTTHYCTVLQ